MNATQYAATGLMALSLSGCADVIVSRKVDGTVAKGLVYALPKANIQVKVQRSIVTPDDVKAVAADAAKAAAQAAQTKADLSVAEELLKTAQRKLEVADPADRDKRTKQVESAQKAVDSLAKKAAGDSASAEEAQDRLDAMTAVLGEWQQTASISVLPLVPQADARYVASINHNATRDDDIKLTVANGLLATSSATSTDQTPAIILSLAQATALLGGGPVIKPGGTLKGFRAAPASPPAGAKPSQCTPVNWTSVFDPTDGGATHAALSQLTRIAPSLRLDVDGAHCKSVLTPDAPSDARCAMTVDLPVKHEPPTDAKGLVYRVPKQVVLTLAAAETFNVPGDPACTFKAPLSAVSVVANVPDSSSAFVLPTHAGAFTTSNMTFAFKDGMPTDFGQHQPSEVAAIAGLPIQIAKALISIPAEMLQLRVNYDSQATAMIDAKTAELKAQLDQLTAQRALAAAKATPATPASPETEVPE
jgi:hypothetical protein